MKSRIKQSGISMVEMLIIVVLAGVLWASFAMSVSYDAKVRRGDLIATSVQPYFEGIRDYARKNRIALQTGAPIVGVANPLQPAVAELQALNHLSTRYPATLNVAGGNPVFRVERLPVGCLGLTCDLGYLFATSTPVLGKGGTVAEGVLSYAASKIGASAGYTDFAVPGTLTGAGGWTVANPNGAVAGILGIYQTYSASGDANFLTIGDARDPGFTGGATISGGTTSVSTLRVTGTAVVGATLTVGPCVDIGGVNGRAGFGCLNKDSLPVGYTGGVVSPDVVASRNLLVSDNRASFTGNNTNYALATADDGTGQAALATSGRVAADRLVPRGSYTPGTPCAAVDEAAIARNAATTGTVSCFAGQWRTQVTYAAPGGPCAPNGSKATSLTGEELICIAGSYVSFDSLFTSGTAGGGCPTLNAEGIDIANGFGKLVCMRNLGDASTTLRWFRLADVTTQLKFVGAVEVSHGTVVNFPSCPVAAGQTALPIAQLRPSRAETSSDGGFTRIATIISPSQWQIVMTNGAGQPLTSNSGTGLAQTTFEIFCLYP
jgi:hypothetical protein